MELGFFCDGLPQTAVGEGIAVFFGSPGVPIRLVVDQFCEHTALGVKGQLEICILEIKLSG